MKAIHPDAKAFLARIVEDPTDALMRLLFADWLDEQGGQVNTNWAGYIRLRTTAREKFGEARDLLLDEAANVAQALTVKLSWPASTLHPHFEFLEDLLPTTRLRLVNVAELPINAGLQQLWECSRYEPSSAVILAESPLAYAAVALEPDRVPLGQMQQTLQRRVIVFGCDRASWSALLQQHTAGDMEGMPRDVVRVIQPEVTLAESLQELLAAARTHRARFLELMAQPKGYEARWIHEGRTTAHRHYDRITGEALVQWLMTHRVPGAIAQPRNTSFGPGVMIELLASDG